MIALEDLEVYRIAESLSDRVWDVTLKWERFSRETVGKQLVRSTDSIGANLAEGFGRFAYKENLQFCYYARGSFAETRYWLNRARKRNLLSEDQIKELRSLMEPLAPKLNAYINSIKAESARSVRVKIKPASIK
jgi:four helix bundle protein